MRGASAQPSNPDSASAQITVPNVIRPYSQAPQRCARQSRTPLAISATPVIR